MSSTPVLTHSNSISNPRVAPADSNTAPAQRCCTLKLTGQIVLGVLAAAAITAVVVSILGAAGVINFAAIPLVGASLAASNLTVVCTAVISLAVAILLGHALYATTDRAKASREAPKKIEQLQADLAQSNGDIMNLQHHLKSAQNEITLLRASEILLKDEKSAAATETARLLGQVAELEHTIAQLTVKPSAVADAKDSAKKAVGAIQQQLGMVKAENAALIKENQALRAKLPVDSSAPSAAASSNDVAVATPESAVLDPNAPSVDGAAAAASSSSSAAAPAGNSHGSKKSGGWLFNS